MGDTLPNTLRYRRSAASYLSSHQVEMLTVRAQRSSATA